jgi:orotate phosphoribosyltransferase-like protein
VNFSRYQGVIFDHIERGRRNAVVDAVAGSGKTMTIIEGLRRLDPDASACVLALNQSIVQELGIEGTDG